MPENGPLYAKALTAIQELFGDMSVSRAEARRRLDALAEEIDIMRESLDADDERDAEAE